MSSSNNTGRSSPDPKLWSDTTSSTVLTSTISENVIYAKTVNIHTTVLSPDPPGHPNPSYTTRFSAEGDYPRSGLDHSPDPSGHDRPSHNSSGRHSVDGKRPRRSSDDPPNLLEISPDPSDSSHTPPYEHLNLLERLNPAYRASYKTRPGVEGDQPLGCMQGTRLKILAALKTWADDPSAPKVCWLHGQLGAGKTSIAHTFSKRLDEQQMLRASFFCTRTPCGSLSDATRIVPTIAYMLAQSDPNFRSAICELLKTRPYVANCGSVNEQFKSLIIQPIKLATGNKFSDNFRVVVIEAIDECSAPRIVESLIKTILDYQADLPLKLLITSRPEPHIRETFQAHPAPSSDIKSFTGMALQEVTQDDVGHDIGTYLRTCLSAIADKHRSSRGSSEWPPADEVTRLVNLCSNQFIYAASAVRHIGATGADYKARLTRLADLWSAHAPAFDVINSYYELILGQAFSQTNGHDKSESLIAKVLATVLTPPAPLSMDGIASLLSLNVRDVQAALSPFQPVIHVPQNGPVTIFRPSFREFIVNRTAAAVRSIGVIHEDYVLRFTAMDNVGTNTGKDLRTSLPEPKDPLFLGTSQRFPVQEVTHPSAEEPEVTHVESAAAKTDGDATPKQPDPHVELESDGVPRQLDESMLATKGAASQRLKPAHAQVHASAVPAGTMSAAAQLPPSLTPGLEQCDPTDDVILPAGQRPVDLTLRHTAVVVKEENTWFSARGALESETTESQHLIDIRTRCRRLSLQSSGVSESSARHTHAHSFPPLSLSMSPQNSSDASAPKPLPTTSTDAEVHSMSPPAPCPQVLRVNHRMIDILDRLREVREAITQYEHDLQNVLAPLLGSSSNEISPSLDEPKGNPARPAS